MRRGQAALLMGSAAALALATPASARLLVVDPDAPPPPAATPDAAAAEGAAPGQADLDAARTAAPFVRDSDVASPRPEDQLKPVPPVDQAAAHRALEPEAVVPDSLDDALIPGRARPGVPQAPLPDRVVQINPGAVRPPRESDFPENEVALPDRWRLIGALCPQADFYKALGAVCHKRDDPYHQNTLKGDRPLDIEKVPFHLLKEDDWFLSLTGISDTIVEPRSFPTPVGVQTTARPGSLDVFGRSSSLVVAHTGTISAALIKGSTAFMPPHIEYRLTLAYNISYADVNEKRILSVRPSKPSHRFDSAIGVQEAFIDYHLRNTSERYDFDSVRVGIQGFQADFRGFLFNDDQLGIRFFGNRDDNRFQYNLAAFWRLEKDTNSGLNSLGDAIRRDWVLIGNVYRQDFPVPGFTSQALVAHEFNREKNRIEIDDNGFPVRPALLGDIRGRNYEVTYLGYNGDGHFDRLNLTVSIYGVLGQDRNSFFTSKPAKVRAFFAAAEPSYDLDWARFRVSALYASGDKKPYDNVETGYDAIFENPVFAGADTSYWIRQAIPFAGGGRAINVTQRNGILNDLRSSKEQGQSNFNNPGTILLGGGVDFDVLPTLRVTGNVNHLWFANTATLEALRVEGSVPRSIGWDTSISTIWRPKMTQNVVFRLSAAMLDAGKGFRDLFTQSSGSGRYYSVLANMVFAF